MRIATTEDFGGGIADHNHEPHGREIVLVRREADDYTMVSAKCLCGVELRRETTPQGTRPNWKDWRVSE